MDPISPVVGALTLLDTAVRITELIDNLRYKENETVALRNDVTGLKLVLNAVKDGPVTPELAPTAAVLERQVKQALDNIGNFIKRYARSRASTPMRNLQKLRWVKPSDNESFDTLIQAAQDVWGKIKDELLCKLSDTMSHRIQAVLDAKGWYTKYWSVALFSDRMLVNCGLDPRSPCVRSSSISGVSLDEAVSDAAWRFDLWG
jgi:hypothetical protein